MYSGKRIAVVMPLHNEEGHVAGAVARVPAYVDKIVAVDDGSTDGSWRELTRLDDKRLVRIRHCVNRGVGAATKTGYARARELGVDLIVVMDGDGQMDGGDLPNLLGPALDGADYVKGNRFQHAETIGAMPRGRYVGNRILSRLTRLAAGYRGHLDAQCGYSVIHSGALSRVDLSSLYERYGFPNEMVFAVLGAGLKLRSAPVKSIYAGETSGLNPLTAVPRILLLILRGFVRRKLSQRRENRASRLVTLRLRESENPVD